MTFGPLNQAGYDVKNTRSIQDYQNSNAEIAQKLQAGQLANQSAANVYATQVISAASATGNPDLYASALQHLQNKGIDTSGWSTDINVGQKQAEAARIAQSPLGALLNAGSKMDANANTAATAAGKVPAGGGNAIVNNLLHTGALTGGVPMSLPNDAPAADVPVFKQVAAQPPALPTSAVDSKRFIPPMRDADETQAAYVARAQQAFEAWKADPATIAEAEKAKAMGTAGGDESKMLDIMKSGLPVMLQRFQNLRNSSADASSGLGVSSEGGGVYPALANSAAGRFLEPKTANANAMLKQNSSQNILGELGPQLQQAGVRGNKFLEQIANQASGMDMSAPPDVKNNIVNGLESTYIANLKSTANQVRLKGLPAPTNEEIDKMVADLKGAPAAGGWTVKRIR